MWKKSLDFPNRINRKSMLVSMAFLFVTKRTMPERSVQRMPNRKSLTQTIQPRALVLALRIPQSQSHCGSNGLGRDY